MKSPFPGMDPYLELRWQDVHSRLMVYASDQLNEQLPSDLQALVEESLDVAIDDQHTSRHLEIIDHSQGGRLVTAIEVLSPANKIGRVGREAYLHKRRQYLEAGVNLVEIDLIRQGEFILAVPQEDVPEQMRTPYLFCIRRAYFPTRAELIHAPLQEPLPNVRIPLRSTDVDVVLQLQPLIDQCYRRGRHDRTNYARELTPPLNAEDSRWAESLLRQNGLR